MIKTALAAVCVCSFLFSTYASAQNVTIHAIDGRSGHPIRDEHLLIFLGNTLDEVRGRAKNANLRTDDQGQAMLADEDSRYKYLQVWVDFHTQCRADPNSSVQTMSEVMSSGVQSPNTCGKFKKELEPGHLYVLVRPANLREKMRW